MTRVCFSQLVIILQWKLSAIQWNIAIEYERSQMFSVFSVTLFGALYKFILFMTNQYPLILHIKIRVKEGGI